MLNLTNNIMPEVRTEVIFGLALYFVLLRNYSISIKVYPSEDYCIITNIFYTARLNVLLRRFFQWHMVQLLVLDSVRSCLQ